MRIDRRNRVKMLKDGFSTPGVPMRIVGALSRLSGLSGDRRGVTAIMFALMLPVVVGFIGMGVEVGYWYTSKRNLQGAADAGAVAGVYENLNGSSAAVAQAQALAEAGRNDYDNTTGAFAYNDPPASGAYTGDANAVQVVLSEPRDLLFSSMYHDGAVTINGSATATLGEGSEACLLALSSTAAKAINASGSTTIDMNGCKVASNSSASNAINMSGGGDLNADCLYTVGGVTGESSSDCTKEGAPATTDPYSDLTVSDADIGTCDFSGPGNSTYSPGSDSPPNMQPGTYCRGLSIGAGLTVVMDPGTYYIDGGGFSVAGGASVSGTGVTIILTNKNGGSYGAVDIAGGAVIDLAAPTSGTYSGILFFQHPDAPYSASSTFNFNGGSTMELTGVLYVPNNAIVFSGGNTTTGNCTKIVGLTVDFSGNAEINNSCAGTGVPSIYLLDKVTLVE
ncbi:MAG: hypothetical protein HOO00_03905 [Rhodospirillaceae bacterium]|jgi:Flp pilus assembly protein TadG|nr:hypothetical protein [Rhodospirillaceae bacterium]MBT5374233.1 hypothetical protein [Rhodospirillaceae bacterium]MBT5751799.1 hypothetical protein [Rhodospirillaceae bacterium]